MNFKTYDTLSSLVPGFLGLLAVLQILEMKFDKDLIIPYTAVAFLLGHLLNTAASWLEDFYFWTWGGKPSIRLMEGKSIWKVKFYAPNVKTLLQSDCPTPNPTNEQMVLIALRVASGSKDTKIEDWLPLCKRGT